MKSTDKRLSIFSDITSNRENLKEKFFALYDERQKLLENLATSNMASYYMNLFYQSLLGYDRYNTIKYLLNFDSKKSEILSIVNQLNQGINILLQSSDIDITKKVNELAQKVYENYFLRLKDAYGITENDEIDEVLEALDIKKYIYNGQNESIEFSGPIKFIKDNEYIDIDDIFEYDLSTELTVEGQITIEKNAETVRGSNGTNTILIPFARNARYTKDELEDFKEFANKFNNYSFEFNIEDILDNGIFSTDNNTTFILPKGTSSTFSGKVKIYNEMPESFIGEPDDIILRAIKTNNGKNLEFYLTKNFSFLYMKFSDELNSEYRLYPTYTENGIRLNVGPSKDEELFTLILGYLGNVSKLKDTDSDYTIWTSKLRIAKNNLANIQSKSKQYLESLVSANSEYFSDMSSCARTLEEFAAYRRLDDPYYDSEFVDSMMSNVQSLTGFLKEMSSASEDQSLIDTYIKNIKDTLSTICDDIYSLTKGVLSVLDDLNKNINKYSTIIPDNLKYAERSREMAINISDAILKTSQSISAGQPCFKQLKVFRQFETWCHLANSYIFDGMNILVQLYIVQEIGINNLLVIHSDICEVLPLLRQISNSLIVFLFKKRLFNPIYYKDTIKFNYLDGSGNDFESLDIVDDSIFDYEIELAEDDDVFVSLEDGYCSLSKNIITKIPDLKVFSNTDISPVILIGDANFMEYTINFIKGEIESDVDDLLVFIDSKLVNYLQLVIIKYIFKGSPTPQEITERVNELDRILDIGYENIKTMLLKYIFYGVLNTILEDLKYLDSNYGESETKYEDLYNYLRKSFNIIAGKEKLLKEKLRKYLAVYTIKKYTEDDTNSLITENLVNEDFLEFLYNSKSISDVYENVDGSFLDELTGKVVNLAVSLWKDLKNFTVTRYNKAKNKVLGIYHSYKDAWNNG